MKVRVKDYPIRYKDTRYKKGDELSITQDAFNDELFVCLDKQKDEKTADNAQLETDDEEQRMIVWLNQAHQIRRDN